MDPEKIKDGADFLITPDGEIISWDDVERIASFVAKHHENPEKVKEFLWMLSVKCDEKGWHEVAYRYVEKVLSLAETPGEKAHYLLAMGIAKERSGDYKAAAEAYSLAFELPQEPDETWYFLNNNPGYCLNQLGQHQEAEKYCRAAIEIQPRYHNAHKNLGIALQGQGRYAEAARSLLRAAKICPTDRRALRHLEDLLTAHKEILEAIPDLLSQRLECHEAAQPGEEKPRLQ